MPGEFQRVLPDNASSIMRTIERVSGERWPLVPVDVIRAFTDPWRCPPHLLNFLAFQRSVDVWNEDWPIEKKRSVIAAAPADHRLKGTEAGIRRYLAHADATLLQVVTAPKRTFATGRITAEQRNAWLARMPEIRVYFVSEKGTRGADAFCGHGFIGHGFLRLDRAEAIHGRKAVLRRPDGTETPLRRSSVETTSETRTGVQVDRFHVPGSARPALFDRGFLRRSFLTYPVRTPYLVTVGLDRTFEVTASRLHLDTARPSLEPIDVRSERASVTGKAGPAVFAGRFLRERFLLPDLADEMLFDRVRLHDPEVDVPWTRAHSFAGSARLGIRPFVAELLAEARTDRPRRSAFIGRSHIGRSFTLPRDLSRYDQAKAAIRSSKALRDRILLSTQTRRPHRLGDTIPLDGSFRLGRTVPVRL